MFELDHVFICTSENAPEAEHLVQFGLTEGTPNIHPGGGTANRRFFFWNAMLELIWVHDVTEAGSETIRPTHLLERWRGRSSGASPFGICVRPDQPFRPGLPFPAWAFHPPYLREPQVMYVADNAAVIEEPMLFYLAFAQRPAAAQVTQPLDHPIGFQEVTALKVVSPSRGPVSKAAAALERLDIATFVRGDAHGIEIEFDGGVQGDTRDFRPHLPLVFRW